MKAELKALWYEHAILVFRNQDITPEKQIEFSRIFGPLELHPLKATTSDAYPELFVLESGGDKDKFSTANYRGEEIVGRLDWHIDLHYTGRPNHGALLRAVVVPENDGLTGFGDLAKAYDALAILNECMMEVAHHVDTATYEAFRLYVLEEWKPAKVAEHLGVTRNTVYLAKNRVINRMRDLQTQIEEIW